MANNLENIEREKVIDIQKKRAEQEMSKRIRRSIENEKRPGVSKILKSVEEDDPNYLKLVKK